MLDLLVFPGKSLENEQLAFSLGMPLFQAVQILQRHCRVIKDVDVVYNENNPFENDLILNLINDGIRLLFECKTQRLKMIEIYDLSKMKLKYNSCYFNSSGIPPTYDHIERVFGATRAPQFDERHHMFVLSFLGITFFLPVDHVYENTSASALHNINLSNAKSMLAVKICIYDGMSLNEASVPPMPLSCFQGNVYSAASDVLMVGGQCDAIQLKLLAADDNGIPENKIQTLIRVVRFGDSTQDVLSEFGSPCQTYYKLEDKMRIHSAGPRKLSSSQHSDYFYNYFTLGLDVLFDGRSHRVKKFVLHSNHPGHYNFNIYYRCDFRIDLKLDSGGTYAVTPTSKWDTVIDKLGGPGAVGKPVVLNRSSSTNNTNPFGSTFCFGIQNMIFEIMNNGYIASVTLYQPRQDVC